MILFVCMILYNISLPYSNFKERLQCNLVQFCINFARTSVVCCTSVYFEFPCKEYSNIHLKESCFFFGFRIFNIFYSLQIVKFIQRLDSFIEISARGTIAQSIPGNHPFIETFCLRPKHQFFTNKNAFIIKLFQFYKYFFALTLRTKHKKFGSRTNGTERSLKNGPKVKPYTCSKQKRQVGRSFCTTI